jgi:hypothetical protein
MDIVYYYWHPEQAPKPVGGQERGGFMFPLKLVTLGWKEFKKTGIYPNPYELAKRINPQFMADIDYLDSLIEQGRPEPPPDAKKQGQS